MLAALLALGSRGKWVHGIIAIYILCVERLKECRGACFVPVYRRH